jgi:hypothetical protein
MNELRRSHTELPDSKLNYEIPTFAGQDGWVEELERLVEYETARNQRGDYQ